MTPQEIWELASKSVCQIIHLKSGKRIATGTGFKIENYIVTNNHVYNPSNSDEIVIQFKEENGIKISQEKNTHKVILFHFLRMVYHKTHGILHC